MSTWARNLFDYYRTLNFPPELPDDIQWLYPQKEPVVQSVLKSFLNKFYNDIEKRTLILGINPGRFGAGITGVNFTAAYQLKEFCGIDHPFKNGSELSAEFIYQIIAAYGGVAKFYSHFFIGSVCPLGFIQYGKNINYYDNKALQQTVEPFIIESLSKLASFPIHHERCICIGGEKNYRFLSELNNRIQWFKNIIAVPHPRFIMQYKRKNLEAYINLYLEVLKK